MNATNANRLIVIGAVIIAGCSPATGTKPTDPAAPTDESPAATDATPTQSAGDITVRFYEYGPTAGGEQLPSFAIQAADLSSAIGEAFAFVEAEATIYTEDGNNITIEAGEASINEETQQASMTGGATVRRGAMTIALEELEWNNEDRQLVSTSPVRIRDGDTAIDAKSMEYRVDDNLAVLHGASGHLSVVKEGTQQ